MGKMNKYKEVDSMRYFTALLLTVIIFSSGILLGNYMTSKKIDALSDIEQNLRLETLGAEIQYQILIGEPCQFVNSTPLTEDLYELAEKLDYLENLRGENDKGVKSLKEQYSLLEIRHWLYTKKINEECKEQKTPILYFYSNVEGECDECEEQGVILTYLRKKYPDLRVYSFDITLDNHAVNTIKDIYEIDEAPAIVIGYRVYPGFMTVNELEIELKLAS